MPSNPAVYNDPRYADCRGKAEVRLNAATGRGAGAAGRTFGIQTLCLFAGTLLPFIDLRQRNQWTAIDSHRDEARREASSTASTWGVATRVLSWYQMIVGWGAIALFALLALRLFERDR